VFYLGGGCDPRRFGPQKASAFSRIGTYTTFRKRRPKVRAQRTSIDIGASPGKEIIVFCTNFTFSLWRTKCHRRAFKRLELEIIKTAADQSIFAWSFSESSLPFLATSDLFASSPVDFGNVNGVS